MRRIFREPEPQVIERGSSVSDAEPLADAIGVGFSLILGIAKVHYVMDSRSTVQQQGRGEDPRDSNHIWRSCKARGDSTTLNYTDRPGVARPDTYKPDAAMAHLPTPRAGSVICIRLALGTSHLASQKQKCSKGTAGLHHLTGRLRGPSVRSSVRRRAPAD